jgi:hypothetical protein
MTLPPGIDTVFVDRPDLAETFADSVEHMSFKNGILRFDLCSVRLGAVNPPANPNGKQYPVARIVMPLDAAVALFNNLNHMFGALEKSGLIKRETSGAITPPNPVSH